MTGMRTSPNNNSKENLLKEELLPKDDEEEYTPEFQISLVEQVFAEELYAAPKDGANQWEVPQLTETEIEK